MTRRARGRRRKTNRDIADEEARRKILKQHRAIHGDACLGTPWCPVPNVAHACDDLTVDHVVAQARGGTLSDGYEVMCRSANSRKGSG